MEMPQHAKERLKGLRSSVHSAGVFTSDFSVNEFLLVRKAGFEPIGLCVGSCVYHVGIQYGSWNKNQELDVLSKAMYHARELALTRMRAEATAMGADGIVGVKLTIKRLEWDAQLLEFIAIGTGVVHGDGHKGFARMTAVPLPRICQDRTSGRYYTQDTVRWKWSWAPASIMWRIAACSRVSAASAVMLSSRTSPPRCTRHAR